MQPIWRETRAISYGQSIPYYPWRQLGRQIVGATDMDAAPVVREKLQGVGRRGSGCRSATSRSTRPCWRSIPKRAAWRSRHLTGEAVVNGVAGAVVNAIKAAIRADDGMTPYVMVMDDLHWSDRRRWS